MVKKSAAGTFVLMVPAADSTFVLVADCSFELVEPVAGCSFEPVAFFETAATCYMCQLRSAPAANRTHHVGSVTCARYR